MRFLKTILFCTFLFIQGLVFAQRGQYPNMLNLQTTVIKSNAIEATVFSDKGAWHAYALPERKEDYGSFIGPLVMDLKGQWLGNAFSQLEIFEQGQPVSLQDAKASINYYPGMLEQQLEIKRLRIVLQLLFVSNREAMLQTKIVNISDKKRELSIAYKGTPVIPGVAMKTSANRLEISFTGNDHRFYIQYLAQEPLHPEINNDSYSTTVPGFSLSKGQRFELTQLQSYYLEPSEIGAFKKYQFANELIKNEKRWNGYLQHYLSGMPNLTQEKKKLAVKSVITLMTNWRSKAKDILHDGVFPSVNYQGFYGVWSWDSWKQAAALAYFFPQLAKDNILSMFDYQDEHGMVADCVYTDKKENNWRDTKPPLAAWSAVIVYQQSKDVDFVKQLYPKLVRYHQWWYNNRDHDKNGLCEYGSTDGTRIAAAWESGMDNAVRFDSAVMIQNNAGAWSLNQESVDLNAYLYAEKIYLSQLATVLGRDKEAAEWKEQATALSSLIGSHFFNENNGYYYDRVLSREQDIEVEGPEAWIPLWTGIATKSQAADVQKIMGDSKKFNTKVPLPTLTADHPKFDPLKGYWRGPVWLDQFYFGIVGLKKYGYDALANELVNKLFVNAEGLMTTGPIRENYHPLTGKGLNAKNFSWSAAHILLLLKLK